MKKGFTLIELLAVIAILAIIMLIATPRILDTIENSRIKAYQQDEQMMIKATETYFGNNVDLLPENIGDTVEVALSELVNNKFISSISDCDGYILVTKIEDGYSYNPQLKCGNANTIASSVDDGLIAYYTFDDFQEPTENLVQEFNTAPSPWGTPAPDVSVSYFDAIDGTRGNYLNMTYYSSGGSRWNQARNYIAVEGGTKYVVSGKVKWEGPTTPSGNIFYVRQYDATNTQIKEAGYYRSIRNESLGDGWYQTYTPITMEPTTTYILFESYQYSTIEIWLYDVQFEKKDHLTPYTPTSREGTIKDYSNKTNNILLDEPTTPTWLEENGNGYYQFDGLTTYIHTTRPTDFDNMSQITASAWIKNGDRVDYDCIFHVNGFRAYVVGGNILRVILDTSEGSQSLYSTTKVNSNFEGWDYVSFTYDGQKIIGYINGKKEEALSADLTGTIPNGNNFQIGKYTSTTSPHFYNGYIDEVKIYNRALSAEEIKYQYDTQKSIYK